MSESTTLAAVTFDDVVAAAKRIEGVAHRTPVITSRTLDKWTGATVFIKGENFQRMGAFKFRGAYNRLAQLSPAERERGVVAFSSGNHAQGVALAAQILNVPATIVMPSDAPQAKVDATRGYGADVLSYDRFREDRTAIARKLVAAGYQVVAIARHESDQLTCAMRKKEPAQENSLIFKAFDLEDSSRIPALVKQLRKEFGSIHGLVNNAGLGTSGVLATMHDAQIQRLVRLNTVSPIILTKYVVRSMMADGGGRIVNVASIAGKEGNANASAYSASKAGVIALTKSLGKETASHNIGVNCITPAAARTRLFEQMTEAHINFMLSKIPRGRFVEVDEISAMVAWLVSEENSFTTGAVFDLSGGRATY